MLYEHQEELRILREHFKNNGYVVFPIGQYIDGFHGLLWETIECLNAAAIRRDFHMSSTGNTPRKMYNVTRDELNAHSGIFAEFYTSDSLVSLVSYITSSEVATVPYKPEEFVASRLRHVGDTHGWHCDDYSFALVVVAENTCTGGEVELRVSDDSLVRLRLNPGYAYLLHSKSIPHRVAPIVASGDRSVLVYSYSDPRLDLDVRSHETMELLYA